MRTVPLAVATAVLCLAAPWSWADEGKKPEPKTYLVPYRLTNFDHVMVRAKINGKGPFNFIIDTGAPALFVATKVAKQVGVEPDRKGWGTFDRFEIEGGVVLEQARARIEDPFQLEGMNGLGLAGAELHGMIGYTVLARYRITFDFTKNKLAWTPQEDFEPKPPERLEGRGGTAGLDAMGALMKGFGQLLNRKAEPVVRTRPFLGLELSEDAKGVVIKSVLDSGPAARAGLRAGDRLTEFNDRTVREEDDVQRYLNRRHPGDQVGVSVERDGQTKEITVTLGEGF